jgi:hypothetical protein
MLGIRRGDAKLLGEELQTIAAKFLAQFPDGPCIWRFPDPRGDGEKVLDVDARACIMVLRCSAAVMGNGLFQHRNSVSLHDLGQQSLCSVRMRWGAHGKSSEWGCWGLLEVMQSRLQ